MKPKIIFKTILLLSLIYEIAWSWCLRDVIVESPIVYTVDYSTNGNLIAVGMQLNTVKVYDAQTLAVKFTAPGLPTSPIKVVKFNTLNTYLAMGFTNGNIFTMDLTTGLSTSRVTGLSTPITSIDFNSDSTVMSVTGTTPNIATYSTAGTGTWTRSNTGFPDISSATFVGAEFIDNTKIMAITNNGSAQIIPSPFTTRTANGTYSNSQIFTCFAIRPDGGTDFIAGRVNGRGYVAPANNDNPIHNYSNNVSACSYSRTLDSFVFTGSDNFVSFYNGTDKTNNLLQRIPIITTGLSTDFSNDGQYLAVALANGNVNIYQKDCVVCQANQYYNVTDRVCKACSEAMTGCGFCQLSSTCAVCIQGYYLLTNKTCEMCQTPMPGCSTCLGAAECIEVISGYYLAASKLPVACQISLTGCLVCNSSTNCLQCSNQYYLTTGNPKTCAQCSTIHQACLFCNSTTQCTHCGLGFYQTGTSCSQCTIGCLTCSITATNCTSCAIGLYLNGNSCSKCVDNCTACNSTACLNCISGFFLSSGTCSACSLPCLTCSSSASSCMTCVSGYFNSSTSCLSCVSPCITCTSLTACLTCLEGYRFDGTSCVRCGVTYAGCQSCNNSACSLCFGGYYLSTGSCLQCSIMYGCTFCSSQVSCQLCSVGLYLSPTPNQGNNSCLPCPPPCTTCFSSTNCSSCISGNYLQSISCVSCVSPCVTCNSAANCNSCIIGYYLNGNVCKPCDDSISNCIVCREISGNVVCLECISSMKVSSNICTPCQSGCLQCSNGTCEGCGLGLFLTSGNCIACGSGCLACLGPTNCVACNVGYSIHANGTCVRCDFPCLICNDLMECISCPVSYYHSSGDCLLCSQGISSCLECSSSSVCTQCSYGYTLITTGPTTSCSSCTQIEGCYNCESTNCLSCLSTYYLSTGACEPCPQGCSSCIDGATCGRCLDGYFEGVSLGGAFSGKCLMCGKYIQGCERCDDFDTCSGCGNGFLLQSDNCIRCGDVWAYCDICEDTKCSGCQGGYFLSVTNICEECSTSIEGCRLCSTDGQTCQACQSGYYLSPTAPFVCNLCLGELEGCTICSSPSACLTCASGYYLDGTICKLCSGIAGCVLCNSATNCSVCLSGYYLDNQLCKVCQVEGCEICNATQPTKCLSCTALYYKLANDSCSICSSQITNCITCLDSTTCQSCSSGFFLQSQLCQQCSTTLPGCQQCKSQTQCVQCQSMYYLNGNSCQLCSSALQGCLYCVNGSSCVSCGVGYYLDLGICKGCSNLEGCVMCVTSNLCLVCGTGYYLESDKCEACSIISGCYSCSSGVVCTSCTGGYSLNSNNECDVSEGSATAVSVQNFTDIELRSVVENATVLKHYLYAKNTNFVKSEIDWSRSIDLFVSYSNGTKENLEILAVEWSTSNSYTIIIYTSNPFTNEESSENISPSMPFTRRLLQSVSKSGSIGIDIDENTIKKILPNSTYFGVLTIKTDLQNPEFYISYIRNFNTNSSFKYFIAGAVVTGLMVIMFLVKALITVPTSGNLGNIMPHILAHKVGALLIYPTYVEYISYCSGFMYADFPWMNTFFGETLSDPRDKLPLAFRVFYTNMNIASMYLLALCSLAVLSFIGVLVGKSVQEGQIKMYGYLRVLYNFFGFGITFAGCASLQGAILNPISNLNVNAAFYIIGILVFFLMIFECIYKNVRDHKLHFWKIRVVIKATMLSLSHFSPIYLLSSAIAIDFALAFVEYHINFYPKKLAFCWIFTNILINCSLAILVFMPSIQLSLIIVSILIVFVLIAEIFMHYFESNNNMVTADFDEKDGQIWNLSHEKGDNENLRVSENTLVNEGNHSNENRIDGEIEHDDMETLGTSRYKRQRKFKKVRGANSLKNSLKVNESGTKNNVNKSSTRMLEVDDKAQNLTFVMEEDISEK